MVIRSLLKAARGQPPQYCSWEAASAAAGSYLDAPVNEFRAARAALGRETGWARDILATPLPMLLSGWAGPVVMTEFGGAFGDLAHALTGAYPGLTCRIVETPAVVARATPSARIAFTTEIPESCDIFYSDGAIQYTPNPYDVVKSAFSSASRAVVFIRNHFADREIFSVQTSRLHHNGGGPIPPGFPDRSITYPIRTIIEGRVLEIAIEHGFKLVFRPGGEAGALVFLKA